MFEKGFPKHESVSSCFFATDEGSLNREGFSTSDILLLLAGWLVSGRQYGRTEIKRVCNSTALRRVNTGIARKEHH